MGLLFLLYFMPFSACYRTDDDECAAWYLFEWDDFHLNPCQRDWTMSGPVLLRSAAGCEAPELERRGVRQNPDSEPEVERGGGLPEALSGLRQGIEPFSWATTAKDKAKNVDLLGDDSWYMEPRVEKVKDRMERIPKLELERFLWFRRKRFEQHYQQKFPWVMPRANKAFTDRPGPEGGIYFYLNINTDRRVIRCKFLTQETLRGLGDQICSEMETWRFPHATQGAEGLAQVEFEVIFRSPTVRCVEDASGFLKIEWE